MVLQVLVLTSAQTQKICQIFATLSLKLSAFRLFHHSFSQKVVRKVLKKKT